MSIRTLWLLLPVTLAILVVDFWVIFQWPPFLKTLEYFQKLFDANQRIQFMIFGFIVIAPLTLWPLLIYARLWRNAYRYQEAMSRHFHCPSCGYVSGVGEDELCPLCASRVQLHGFYKPTSVPPLVRRSFWIRFVPAAFAVLYFCQNSFQMSRASLVPSLICLMVMTLLCLWANDHWRFWRLRSRVADCEGRMCPTCGYELAISMESGTCPECGSPFVLNDAVRAWKQWRNKSYPPGSGPTQANLNRYQILVVVTVFLLILLVPAYASAVHATATANTARNAAIAASVAVNSSYESAGPEARQILAFDVHRAERDASEAVQKANEAAKKQDVLTMMLGLPLICAVIAAIGLWRKRRTRSADQRNMSGLHA